MKTFAATLILLAACGGDDMSTGPDAAGTTSESDVDCALMANSASVTNLVQLSPNQACAFSVAGIAWIDSMGLPAVFSTGIDGVTLDYIGPDLYRSDMTFRWTGDAGKNGIAMPTKTMGRCAWARCRL